MQASLIHRLLRTNPDLVRLLDAGITLPDAWLVAGALNQTIWNHLHNFPPAHGIHDIDLIYHDPADLSAESEAAIEADLRQRFGLPLDVKNQARVHLWYNRRFGRTIEQHPSSQAAIATFPTTATAIGISLAAPDVLHAPFGFDDLLALTVRPNPVIVRQADYEAKCRRWAAAWPRLFIIPWTI